MRSRSERLESWEGLKQGCEISAAGFICAAFGISVLALIDGESALWAPFFIWCLAMALLCGCGLAVATSRVRRLS